MKIKALAAWYGLTRPAAAGSVGANSRKELLVEAILFTTFDSPAPCSGLRAPLPEPGQTLSPSAGPGDCVAPGDARPAAWCRWVSTEAMDQ